MKPGIGKASAAVAVTVTTMLELPGMKVLVVVVVIQQVQKSMPSLSGNEITKVFNGNMVIDKNERILHQTETFEKYLKFIHVSSATGSSGLPLFALEMISRTRVLEIMKEMKSVLEKRFAIGLKQWESTMMGGGYKKV